MPCGRGAAGGTSSAGSARNGPGGVDACSAHSNAVRVLGILVSWLVLGAAFWLTAAVLPGFQLTGGWRGAAAVSAIFGIINWLIGWLLFVVLGIVSLGLGFLLAFVTRWLVNAILLRVTDAVSDRLKIESFKTALIGALLISLFGTIGQWLVGVVLS
jgi:putative membrane protein